jgi:hypothetical protein
MDAGRLKWISDQKRSRNDEKSQVSHQMTAHRMVDLEIALVRGSLRKLHYPLESELPA